LGQADSSVPDIVIDAINGGVPSINSVFNLVRNNGASGLPAGSIVSSADPLLDPNGLQNNGGPTRTLALQPGSPAQDASFAILTNLSTDQRGTGFPRTLGTRG